MFGVRGYLFGVHNQLFGVPSVQMFEAFFGRLGPPQENLKINFFWCAEDGEDLPLLLHTKKLFIYGIYILIS